MMFRRYATRIMSKRRSRKSEATLVAVGLDSRDGHVRITQGENFSAYFGSEETHDRMQEFCMKFTEKIERKGLQLGSLSRREFKDIASELL